MDAVVSADPLAAHIAASMARPYDWGVDNCALWVAAGIAAATGFDPAADLRGRCGSRFLTRRMIARAGGLLPFVAARMAAGPFLPFDGAGAAVVRVAGEGEICAFVRGGRAIARSAGGVVMFDAFEIREGWSWRRL